MASDGQTTDSTHDVGTTSSGSVATEAYIAKEVSSSTGTGDTPVDGSMSTSNDASKGQLAKKETEYVNRQRWLVLVILLCAGVGVSVLVYFLSKQSFEDEMEAQFQSASTRLTDAFEAIRTQRIATLASLAIAAIAHGVDHSRDWPFVTLSSYQQRAFTAKLNSGALQVSIIPTVPDAERTSWEEYIVSDEAEVDWIERSILYQSQVGADKFVKDYGTSFRDDQNHTIKYWNQQTDDILPMSWTKPRYMPLWETSPFLSFDDVNVDISESNMLTHAELCLQEGAVVVGDMEYEPAGGINSPSRRTSTFAQLISIAGDEVESYKGDPMTQIYIPIFDSFEEDGVAKAMLVGLFNWGSLFENSLPPGIGGIDVVLRNNCYEPFTYRVFEHEVVPLGKGDLHSAKFSSWEVTTPILETGRIAGGTSSGLGFVDRGCYYSISIYPSQQFSDEYDNATPAVLSALVSFVFLFAIGMFFLYDRLVERRQALVLRKALQSTAIVSSLFPKNVRDRIMTSNPGGPLLGDSTFVSAFRDKMRKRRRGGDTRSTDDPSDREIVETTEDSDPIADLFPQCTVLFADIAGFTAWSSTRDPSQVFTLLQNLYQAFDVIAMRRRVFKVETIGDSYVAVTGLPDPQQAHAVIMAKFARDCLHKLHDVTRALEVRLGPDTTELSMRFGLNSGQVTGGVLRGDRARFQLFGDTVNTAARMESTGERGRIQLSQATADLLVVAGKEHWIRPREDAVTAKGKGTLQTYWLEIDGGRLEKAGVQEAASKRAIESKEPSEDGSVELASQRSINSANKQARLIGWMSEVLLDYVKQIVAKNRSSGVDRSRGPVVRYIPSPGSICLDEIVESFTLSKTSDLSSLGGAPSSIDFTQSVKLDPAVEIQLRQYVIAIALRYHPTNPFHNFDHACHVTMSVHKLMKRVASDGNGTTEEWAAKPSDHAKLATYGILTSDPLTLFAIVFSGLIHDVDHKGVSNLQLSKEEPSLASRYRYKSIAEQNSVDIAWELLMSSSFDTLRQALFPTLSDLLKFRQVVVNTVLATDIFDKQRADSRKERWNRVFGGGEGKDTCDTNPPSPKEGEGSTEVSVVSQNTRATIVLEHIIQASDVSHTMQHWHVYIKWNRKLFEELHLAHKKGRMEADPAAFWYTGELAFFDNYVIPLANKLRECQVFGASSDEYLNYALSNRREWEAKGETIVKEMVEAAETSEASKILRGILRDDNAVLQ